LEDGRSYLEPELAELRANGELTEYTDEDLITAAFIAIWKKPADTSVDVRADSDERVDLTQTDKVSV